MVALCDDRAVCVLNERLVVVCHLLLCLISNDNKSYFYFKTPGWGGNST